MIFGVLADTGFISRAAKESEIKLVPKLLALRSRMCYGFEKLYGENVAASRDGQRTPWKNFAAQSRKFCRVAGPVGPTTGRQTPFSQGIEELNLFGRLRV